MSVCETCKYDGFNGFTCPVKSIKVVTVVKGVGITECPKHETK